MSVRSEVGSYLPSWRKDTDYKKSVSAKKKLGGGVLLELSHDIDYLFWLFGKVEWVSATIYKQSNLKIDTEDTAIITLGFLNNKKKNKIIANLNMDFNRHDTTRYCKVIGELGTLYWNAIDGSVRLFKKGSSKWKTLYKENIYKDKTYISELKHFIYCVKNKQTPMVDGLQGLEIIKSLKQLGSRQIQIL